MNKQHENRTLFRPNRSSLLLATGEDASTFLQGQWSQDVRSVSEGRAARGLWLDRKGKVQGDAWILRNAAGVYSLFSLSMTTADLRARLEAFIVADDVALEEPPMQGALCLSGPGIGNVLEKAGVPLPDARTGAVAWSGGGFVLHGAGPAGEPALWTVGMEADRMASVERIALEAGFTVLEYADAERARVAAGIARIPEDCGPGDLPGEADLEADTVCYTKGCFIGQEVLARLRAQGTLRRGLRRVSGTQAAPPRVPAPLHDGARKVGDLRSAIRLPEGGWIGLAMLTLAGLPPLLHTSPEGDEVRVENAGSSPLPVAPSR